MKNIIYLFFSIVILTGCKDKITDHYTANIPIYMSLDDLRSATQYADPLEITTVSGLFLHDQYLLLIKPLEGIHVMDNSDPSNPINMGFMVIPGITNVDVKNNHLFADSYIDLVTLDISDINNPVEIGRSMNQFTAFSMKNYDNQYAAEPIDDSKGVVVGWEIGQTSQEVDYFYTNYEYSIDVLEVTGLNEVSFNTGVNLSGSITKFAILNDYLYVINNNIMKPYNISNPAQVVPAENTNIPFNVETIFDYNDHLFLGTNTGMVIYNTIIPERPEQVSVIAHIPSCDPVVVQGDYAYVTLRSGNVCFNDVNVLEVYNIADYSNPYQVGSFEMTNPHGLGIDGNTLFICDGDAGLRVFDATNPSTVGEQPIAHFPEINAIDIIPFNHVAMLFGEDGLRQYDYSDWNNVHELSFIPFN